MTRSHPNQAPDPDPLHVDIDDGPYWQGFYRGTMSQPAWPRIVVVFAIAILLAFAIGLAAGQASAAPRSAATAIHRVTICALAGRCVTRVSTDAGPDLAMQRAGRVADVSYADFAYICGCRPEIIGLIRVTVQYGPTPTLPPTDLYEGMGDDDPRNVKELP